MRRRRVAGLAKLISDQVDGELLPGANLARRSIDFRGIGEDRLLEPLVYDSLVFDVEDREDRRSRRAQETAQTPSAIQQNPAIQRRCPDAGLANLIFTAIATP